MFGERSVPPAEAQPLVSGRITATADGRRLRLELTESDLAFVVDPIPAKRGRALKAAHDEDADRGFGGIARRRRLAEALGPENYALITGDCVQVFDQSGTYLQTFLPGAVMVEPAGDVPAVPFGERIRVVDAPWDGLPLRAEEIEALALTALNWQIAGA